MPSSSSTWYETVELTAIERSRWRSRGNWLERLPARCLSSYEVKFFVNWLDVPDSALDLRPCRLYSITWACEVAGQTGKIIFVVKRRHNNVHTASRGQKRVRHLLKLSSSKHPRGRKEVEKWRTVGLWRDQVSYDQGKSQNYICARRSAQPYSVTGMSTKWNPGIAGGEATHEALVFSFDLSATRLTTTKAIAVKIDPPSPANATTPSAITRMYSFNQTGREPQNLVQHA
jgi:hypothetical protein